ncbi:DUF2019 domain-containing protein [Sandaracinus amylolyticus]|nr:DUF2019 domain-containing protein [Sandaracinus amylolyticus]
MRTLLDLLVDEESLGAPLLELVRAAVDDAKRGAGPSRKRLELNRFEITIDVELDEAVIEDVLEPPGVAVRRVSTRELIAALERARRDRSPVRRYADAARRHEQGTNDADPRKANRAARELTRLWKQIRRSDEQLAEFVELLGHEALSVRLWAATHLLPIDPLRAERAIEELTREPGILGFGARMTLQEWRAGRLREP